MEIRELVKLKKGVGGLEPPLNIGILLDRTKEGKDHQGILFTPRGKMKIKWKFLKEAGGRIYQGDKQDEVSMREFLRKASDDERKGLILRMEPEEIIEKVRIKDLWRSVVECNPEGKIGKPVTGLEIPSFCQGRIFSTEDIGSLHFKDSILEPRQIQALSKVLSTVNDPANPYFHMMDGKKERSYLPYSCEAVERIRDHISRMEGLRSVFVHITEEEAEDGRIFRKAVPNYSDPREAVLEDEDQIELDRICSWAYDHLENGRWVIGENGGFGLGDTPATTMDDFNLERFMADLSHHITDSGARDLPSDLVGMLLRLGRISWKRASELVVNFNLGSGLRKFKREFPDHVLKLAGRIEDIVTESEMEGRLDLRDMETYTIDPPDAKDFDDAVSIGRDDDGNFDVWIHIADVSHYVRTGDLIDDEARYRGTSVYLPTGVIPMLPPKLSEEMCSLREKEDRLAVSTRIVISRDMEIISREHRRTIIRVNDNLSYDTVNDFIDEGREPFSTLWELSLGLKRSNTRLSLDTPERRIRFKGENSMDIRLKNQTKAMAMIEQLMVITNEAAAEFIVENGLPVPYRVHPLPDSTSVKKFNATCNALGMEMVIELPGREDVGTDTDQGASGDEESMLKALMSGGKISFGALNADPEPFENEEEESKNKKVPVERIRETVESYNRALAEIDGLNEEDLRDLLKIRMLRTMPRAFYSEENTGHFGLGSRCYCHFTSPIRRYPDILAHRALTSLIEKRGGPKTGSVAPEIEEISDILEHVNEMSDEAEDWEREMVDVALSTRALMDKEFRMREHGSIIRSMTPSTIYTILDDGVTEGSLPIRSLSTLRLHVDENETCILASLQGNEGVDPEDPLIRRLLENEGKDITLIRIGDRKSSSLHSISIARGRISISFSDIKNG